MVKLTNEYGVNIYVNPELVCYISDDWPRTKLWFAGGVCLVVQGALNEVREALDPKGHLKDLCETARKEAHKFA